MIGISAVILSKNEEDRITRCIESVSDLVDEVIVVDSGSTDRTVEIARSLGAIVYAIEWKGFGNSKNFGNEKASNNWILSIDSDEWLSNELIEEIRSIPLQEKCIYAMDRSNIYLGKTIRHSGWSSDWVLRLFHKSDVYWNDNLVHEKLTFTNEYSINKLTGKLMHDSYRSVEDHQSKIEKYAMLKAESWIKKGNPPSILKRYFGSFFKGFHSYIIKLGFLDGKEGLIIAKMNVYLVRKQIAYYDSLKDGRL
jgi:glycosyltransferase involved in cell wall biosynthesis